mmetsp:Transcript_48775/g.85913  ORF Transcript_48775/g.85913 Transcript_48775/m.85913 type:complete len:150 (+) Transcript_48775:50-499(+)
MSSNVWSNLRDKFKNQERCSEASCHDKEGDAGGDDDGIEPPDRAEIGRAAWRYLHTRAANYPERPSGREQEDAQAWIASFVQLYPCSHCAEAFVEICAAMPPNVSTRTDHSMWWCKAHNSVSADLMKEAKPCDPAKLIAAGQNGLFLDE